jgi:hypothetical protein
MSYYLEIRDEQGCTHNTEMGGDGPPSNAAIESECEDWVSDGEWGNDGVSVNVWWTLTDEDGDEIETGSHTVEIEPNHSALIWEACGYTWDESGKHIKGCGEDPDDHDWTSEGEGGCDENPGVWSTGGTSMSFATHCRKCGLQRHEHSTGSQRNPGEHDTVSYEMPDSWCAECQKEINHDIDGATINYTDCDDDQPAGEYMDGFATEEEARECAKETACRKAVASPDRMVIVYDDRENGTGTYDVYIVS